MQLFYSTFVRFNVVDAGDLVDFSFEFGNRQTRVDIRIQKILLKFPFKFRQCI